MSLEEFLGDDTLGDSVWNEDDINLDAISNTTNIDLLKNKTQKQELDGQHDAHHPFGYQQHHFGRENDQHPSFATQGPPYIVKFSQLPPSFSDGDIHDLFHEKFTKFVKFKLFWELNKNPTIDTLKSGSIFDQNFKRISKVAFVELYSGRDMDKIIKFWATPLLKIHKIKTEPAEFDDFKEYRVKIELLTDPKDDASKSYLPSKPKNNPFGAAKPVDTQSKILAIEETVGKLHIEDTKTLRRLSEGESGTFVTLKPGKVTLLKKTAEEETDTTAVVSDRKTKPLSYLEVIKRSAEEPKKSSSFSTGSSSANALSSPNTVGPTSVDDDADFESSNQDNTNSDFKENENGKSFTFKDSDRSRDTGAPRHSFQDSRSSRGGRGGGYTRGANTGTYRGRGGGRGGRGGGSFQSRFQQRDQNDSENFQSRKFNRPNQTQEQKQIHHQNQGQNQGYGQDENRYSMFKPASGFLWEGGNDNATNNHNSRGGYNNNNHRGSHRCGFNNRNRHNNGFTAA